MKAILVPVAFRGRDADFDKQLAALRTLLADSAEILAPVPLGGRLPDADAVLFPQLLGEAFRSAPALKRLGLPVLVLTSEFGTVNMWDWEIVTFMKGLGLEVFTPYTMELTRLACRGFALRREMRSAKFLVFQDNPGEGMQAEIFKRFYWWEDACSEAMRKRFGMRVVKKSFKALGEKAKRVPDAAARDVLARRPIPFDGNSGALAAVGGEAVPRRPRGDRRRGRSRGRRDQLPERVLPLRHHPLPGVGPCCTRTGS